MIKNPFSRMSRQGIIACIAGSAALFAGITMLAIHAATSFVDVEPETATLTARVSVGNDSAASGGKYIQFTAPSPTPPPPAPTPTPTPPPTNTSMLQPFGLGFAPYAYIPWEDTIRAAQIGTGAKNYVAAFVLAVGNSCTPAWDGDSSLGINSSRGNAIASDIASVRANGGDVMISFGGQGGTELAVGCTSTANLKTAYRSVIDKYSLTKIDFDIEGSTLSNTTANTRRADALALLHQELPNVKIWVTLPVDTVGIPASAKTVLTQLRDKGVPVSGINIMVMDYGTNNTQMGQAAIQAANSTFSQLKTVYTTSTDAQIWKALALTAMIGINDTQPEKFTLTNAQEVHTFAVQKGIGMLSYWNTARDKACPNNATTLSDTCSGVTQSPWQFASTMMLAPSN